MTPDDAPQPGSAAPPSSTRTSSALPSGEPRPRSPRAWRARAARLSDQVPTRWILTGATAVVLAASAAFGGLEDAPAEALPTIAAGEAVTGAQLRVAVERARVIDALPEAYVTPEDGNRLLVVVATVEDVWDGPVATVGDSGAIDAVLPVGVPGVAAGTAPTAVLLLADGTASPELQPHVPMELAYVWELPADVLAVLDGDELVVDVYDKTYRADGFVTTGERFEAPFVQARTAVPLEDVGAGAPA